MQLVLRLRRRLAAQPFSRRNRKDVRIIGAPQAAPRDESTDAATTIDAARPGLHLAR